MMVEKAKTFSPSARTVVLTLIIALPLLQLKVWRNLKDGTIKG